LRTRALVIACAFACACREQPPPDPAAARQAAAEAEIDTHLGLSRDAKREIWTTMRADMIAPRTPADGGGRAWIDSVENAAGQPVVLSAGERARIRLTYEAGPLGIARGGTLEFRGAPWWRWDPPQPLDRNAPGFTEASVSVDGARIRYGWDGLKLSLRFSKPLAAGDRVQLVYGAGPALTAVDTYAERRERLWFGVDGDGDGVLTYLPDSPPVDIAAGPPATLRVVLPASARPGEDVLVRVSVLDSYGNAGVPFDGEVRLSGAPGLALPGAIRFRPADRGIRSVSARAAKPGIDRVTGNAVVPGVAEPISTTSNPLVVEPGAPRLYWADLHGHSQLSDGTGTPEDYYCYARDVAGLDAAALTDHDHFGVRFLDATPSFWQEIRAATAAFHAPGRFVTLVAYEWTSLLQGHRHVLFFADDGPVYSSFDPRYQTPTQLWDALRGQPALTFAHHSAGGPISTNWRYRPDPVLEPVTEIVSVHGNSEAPEAPIPIYDPVPGNFVRDVLGEGVQLGFIGSGDSHDGHPGATHFGAQVSFGLAAIWADELTREAIRRALQARRVYATNGARIWLELSLDGAPMGSAIAGAESGAASGDALLRMRVIAEAPLERIELVRRAGVTTLPLAGELEWRDERAVARVARGDYLYARVVQRDGGAAWSSPIYAE
jgi:hypothetical protein